MNETPAPKEPDPGAVEPGVVESDLVESAVTDSGVAESGVADAGAGQPESAAAAPGAAATASDSAAPARRGLSRRHLFGASSVAALTGLAAGRWAGSAAAEPNAAPAAPADVTYPFRGAHQSGITTAAQDRMHVVALDVITKDKGEFRTMLHEWTRAAERMTYGAEAAPGGAVGLGQYGVPTDTGEALDLTAAGLTITVGYGPSLFKKFGLEQRRPKALTELPKFVGDDLDPKRSGGDIVIQACADDPQVAVHAVRNLIRMGAGVVSVRWSQLGFGRTSSTTRSQKTPRNLFGFKDGTANLRAEDTQALDEHVWVAPSDVSGQTAWAAGGTYMVTRRIRMHIEVWDRSNLADQEATFGRGKLQGQPLSGTAEMDVPDFHAQGPDGKPAIPINSHMALAHPTNLKGVQILRRGYNFTDGTDGIGHLDAGLFFIAFCRDAHKQFVPMQKALAKSDLMNEYIEHTGSGIFFVPPGLGENDTWSSQLFGKA